jgi:hypothetical protein
MLLSGYGGRDQLANTVHDDLRCQALLLEEGHSRVALLTCDLIGLAVPLAHAWRAELAAALGTPESRVLINCSHTHSGPNMLVFGERPTVREAAHHESVKHCLLGVAETAAARLRPARLRLATGRKRLQRNRRDRLPGSPGPVDDSLGVLCIDDAAASAVTAVVVHYACHPVVLRSNNLGWSADYVGWLRAAVHAATGATCLFLQGAAGDLIPDAAHPELAPAGQCIEHPAEHDTRSKGFPDDVDSQIALAQRFGRALGSAAAHLSTAAQDIQAAPGSTDGAVRLGAIDRTCRAAFAPVGEPQSAPAWAAGQPVPFGTHCLRLGSVAIVGLPVEPLNAIGLRLRAHASDIEGCAAVWCAGYTNGCYGYLPPKEEYTRGGYEPGSAHRFYRRPGPFTPDTAERVLAEALAGVTALWSEQQEGTRRR